MNVTSTFKISEALQSTLQELGGFDYVGTAAEGAYHFLVDYHQKMDWKGSKWIQSPNSGQFAGQLAKGWQPPAISGDTATITNTFGLLAWKVSGGTITPKRAKMLTIPLTTAARATSAREFYGGLVMIGKTLSIKHGTGTFEPQYALAKSVTQQPWPDAMPSDEAITEAATNHLLDAIQAKIGST